MIAPPSLLGAAEQLEALQQTLLWALHLPLVREDGEWFGGSQLLPWARYACAVARRHAS